MDVRQLELFLAVMECSSVTRAAARVNLSPGAVSLQLQNLAADLRAELFVRAGKRLAPTPAAHRLAELAQLVVRQMRQIEDEFANDPTADTRPFYFATGATTLIHRLGAPLRLLRKQFPNTPLKITVAATEDMVAGLLDRRYDLALISLPVEDENIAIVPLFDEELVIIQPSAKPVRAWHIGNIEPAALASEQFILYPQRSNMRTIINGFFHDAGIAPRVIMEAEDTEAIKRLVEAGFGYSILPEYALRSQPRFFRMFRVPAHLITRRQALATARLQHPRAVTSSIIRFLQTTLTSGQPRQ